MENVLNRVKIQYNEALKKQEQDLLDQISKTTDQAEGMKLYTEFIRLKQKNASEQVHRRMSIKMNGKAPGMLFFNRPDLAEKDSSTY